MRGVTTILFLILLIPIQLFAQLEVRDTIVFTSSSNSDRMIDGLGYPIDSSSAANVESIVSGGLNYALVGGTADQISLTMQPAIPSYSAGLSLTFFASSANTGTTTVDVDGLGLVPLRKSGNLELDSADIIPGLAVMAVYDGSQFLIISPLSKQCRPGFLPVNDRFCIQQDEQGQESYWNAVVTCGDMDARLCTWSEWHSACANLGASLNDMINNWEYIDSGQNYDNGYLPKSSPKLIGNSQCETSGRANPDDNHGYRCCHSR